MPKRPASRSVERIELICDQQGDSLSLRAALLEEIRGVVPFEAYAWLLTDPESEVGGSPLAEVPWLSELPRQIGLKYRTPVNRWTTLDAVRPAALLHAATGGHLHESLVWREFLCHHDVTDVASLVFRDRFGCWAFLELWRIGAAEPYTDAHADYLARVAQPITTALRHCQARTFAAAAPVSESAGPVVLVLSPELDVRAQTPETEEYLRLLVPPGADRRPIPAGAYNVAAQRLCREAGVDDHLPMVRVNHTRGLWLTLKAARMGSPGGGAADDVAVSIERTSPADRLDVFARANGLTAREIELLTLLAGGADTRTVAAAMFVSEHTVQDHLKSIFAKTETTNRRALLARATSQ